MKERGQSIPFWLFATLGMLAMLLTVLNYGAQVYWNVRAQTAADSAAAAGLSVQANIWNEESTILYAAAVDEYRLRELNQAILNTLNQQGGCKTGAPMTCAAILPILKNAYGQASQNFGMDIQLLAQANQFTQGGQGNHKSDAQTLLGTCTNGTSGSGPKTNAVDNAFCYTVVTDSTTNNTLTPHTVAVMACRNQPYVGGAILGLQAASFEAIASAASSLSTGNTEAALVSNYQQRETAWYGQTPALTGTALQLQPYDVDNWQKLTVNVNWYTAVQQKAKSVANFPPASPQCLNP